MAVDYTPTLGNYTELKPFRYWCQKVLPLVYDDSLSYYELLCKVVDYLNKTMEDVETLHNDVDNLHTAYEQLQQYVNDYFDNLDVQAIINNKLDVMASDGTLSSLVAPLIPDQVSQWLQENISPTTPAVDSSLSVSGAAADAKVTGGIRQAITDYNSFDFIRSFCNFPTVTHNGITFTYDADKHEYTVNGTSTAQAFVNLLVSQASVPEAFTGSFNVNFEREDSRITLSIVQYIGGSTPVHNIYGDEVYEVPDSLTGIIIRFVVPNGVTINNAKITKFAMMNTLTNAELTEAIEDINDHIEAKEVSTDLFSIDKDTMFGQVYSSGTQILVIDNLGMTGYIPVTPGNFYTTPITDVYCLWYDSSKNYVSRTERPTVSGYQAPDNVAYGRFIFDIGLLNNYYVKEVGTTYPTLIDGSDLYIKSPYENMFGVAFGTSLTERGLATYSGGYTQYLQTLGQMAIKNMGIGSSVILADGVHQSILSAVKNYNGYSGKKFVLLEGFVNDWGYNSTSLGQYDDDTETTVCGCVRSALNYIMEHAPYVTVFLILDNYGKNYNGVNNASTAKINNLTQYQFYEEIAKVAESLSVPVIKLYAISGINEYTPGYLLDNIHPTAAGAEQAAKAIWSVMKDTPPKTTV